MMVDIGLVTDEVEAPAGREKKTPRVLLRRRLGPLREAAGKTQAEAAAHLGVTVTTIRRWETGESKISVANLRVLCAFYGASDEEYAELESLRAALSDINWWRRFGPRPDSTAGLLELEPAADEVRSFDLLYIPGLLQTPGYARAIIGTVELGISREQLDSGVELRMQRQARVFDGVTPRKLTFIVDQAALERMPGPIEVRRAQLARLRRPPDGCTVRILPFDRGPHPAATGFTIFGFASEEIPTAVHVEWSETTKGDLLEDNLAEPYERYWERLEALALSEKESFRFLKTMMERN